MKTVMGYQIPTTTAKKILILARRILIRMAAVINVTGVPMIQIMMRIEMESAVMQIIAHKIPTVTRQMLMQMALVMSVTPAMIVPLLVPYLHRKISYGHQTQAWLRDTLRDV